VTTPIVRVNGLTKSFQNRRVIDDLSFEIHRGQTYGFLGPNGAGKSTTIRMMLSLVRPDAGDIELFGKSLGAAGQKVLQGVGALVEEADFYEYLSARKNLRLLATMEGVPEKRIEEVITQVGLTEWADEPVKRYSHGMKQRLGIAQALLPSPEFLILDEPTTGLDPRGMKEVRELIQSLHHRGLTIFLSSHLLNEVEQICSAVAIIHRGKLITSGTMDELIRETDLFVTEVHANPQDTAREILADLSFVRHLEQDDSVLKLNIASEDVPRMNAALVESGVEVSAIIPRTRLEDYFLEITEDSREHPE